MEVGLGNKVVGEFRLDQTRYEYKGTMKLLYDRQRRNVPFFVFLFFFCLFRVDTAPDYYHNSSNYDSCAYSSSL